MKHMYPNDGGLKAPVRRFEETSKQTFEMIIKHFTKDRSVGQPDNR